VTITSQPADEAAVAPAGTHAVTHGAGEHGAGHAPERRTIVSILTTTDHKTIGLMYIVTSFLFFLAAGLMALFMRVELARPGLQLLSEEQYNQLFTMHGTIMLLFYATSMAIGLANFIVPLQIGAPDVAFPRLNAMGYWFYAFGGLMAVSGFLTPGGAADPAPGQTSGSSACSCPGWGRSWAPSTSSPRSSPCARRA